MRKIDRKKNDMAFPKLYYPELYLLEGGYKAFYEQYPVSRTNTLGVQVCHVRWNIMPRICVSLTAM